MRNEFAAKMSHEIRTPLSGILGVMHPLRRTQLDRNQLRYVDTASNSANMLLTIINDVLAYTRMDSTWLPVELESLNLGGCSKITDAGVVHLEGLTGLKWLNFLGTKVTDAGVEKLKAALPECEITH